MDVIGWTESWFVQLAGQTFVCLALGLWIAAWLKNCPARAFTVVFLAIMAALATPVASLIVRQLNTGLFLGAPDPTDLSLAGEKSTGGWFPVGGVPIALWGIVSLTLLTGIAVSFLRGRRLVARSEPVSEPHLLAALAAARKAVGLRAQPELRSHAQVPSPMVWAWSSSPVALIPDEATAQVHGIEWESIFIHELAHVARRDHFAFLFADIAAALLFWNPAIWWARRQFSRESEFASDDRVALAGKSPVEFAGALLALRREALVPRIPATNLTGSRSWLKARVRRLLQINARPPAPFGAAWLAGAVSATMAIVIALALAQSHQESRPEDSFAKPLAAALDRTFAHAP